MLHIYLKQITIINILALLIICARVDASEAIAKTAKVLKTKPAYNIDFVFFDRREVESFNNDEGISSTISTLLLATEKLPKTITMRSLPALRIWRTLEQANAVCTLSKLKTTDRQEQFLFSNPTSMLLSARIFSRKDEISVDSQSLNERGEIVSLATLAEKQPESRIFFSHGRSYGEEIDRQLASLKKEHKEEIVSSAYFGRDVELFLRGRGDFLIVTPAVIDQYFLNRANDLNSYALAGNQRYLLGHVLCNDRPESREFIKDLNQALEQLYSDPLFKQAHIQHHSEAFGAEMETIFDAVFLQKSG